MVRRSGLSSLVDRPEPTPEPETSLEPAVAKPEPAARASSRTGRLKPAAESAKGGSSRYAGQVHVGASYGETDDTVNDFRELAFRQRRSTKDLLHEAMQLVVAKYDKFNKAER